MKYLFTCSRVNTRGKNKDVYHMEKVKVNVNVIVIESYCFNSLSVAARKLKFSPDACMYRMKQDFNKNMSNLQQREWY